MRLSQSCNKAGLELIFMLYYVHNLRPEVLANDRDCKKANDGTYLSCLAEVNCRIDIHRRPGILLAKYNC